MPQTYSGMGSIVMKKDDLLKIVRKNREEHHEIFEKAVVIFREEAVRRLDKLISDLKAGKTPSLYIALPVPEEHTDEYDRAIAMLERHQGETKELTEQGYMQLVDNEWQWSSIFAANTLSYVAGTYNGNGQYAEL